MQVPVHCMNAFFVSDIKLWSHVLSMDELISNSNVTVYVNLFVCDSATAMHYTYVSDVT